MSSQRVNSSARAIPALRGECTAGRRDQLLAPPAGNAHQERRDHFLRLPNLDNDIVDRLSRYEAALWRHLAQTLFTLQALRRGNDGPRCSPNDRPQ
jgi:hypothetical protein